MEHVGVSNGEAGNQVVAVSQGILDESSPCLQEDALRESAGHRCLFKATCDGGATWSQN